MLSLGRGAQGRRGLGATAPPPVSTCALQGVVSQLWPHLPGGPCPWVSSGLLGPASLWWSGELPRGPALAQGSPAAPGEGPKDTVPQPV